MTRSSKLSSGEQGQPALHEALSQKEKKRKKMQTMGKNYYYKGEWETLLI